MAAVLSMDVTIRFAGLPSHDEPFRLAQFGFKQAVSVGKILVANEKLRIPILRVGGSDNAV
jgi:hypothetical protein